MLRPDPLRDQVGREDGPGLLREAGGGIVFQAHIFPFGKMIA
jgi:hypothetical protein